MEKNYGMVMHDLYYQAFTTKEKMGIDDILKI